MKIIFVRHAEKEEIGEDPYLTKKGVKQAEYLAKKLKKENFDEFYCSAMNRTKQTAEIISRIIRIKPKIEKSLNEFKSEILIMDKKNWDREEKTHHAELIHFLERISKKPDDKKSILIIAHGITNRIILSYFLNLNPAKLIFFRQTEAGINAVYWAEKYENWRLKIWNDDSHIPLKFRDDIL